MGRRTARAKRPGDRGVPALPRRNVPDSFAKAGSSGTRKLPTEPRGSHNFLANALPAMAKAIFTSKISSSYDDLPEERYHFPRTYLKAATAAIGDWIVYYEPRRPSDSPSSTGGRQSYFATARVVDIRPDPKLPDHYYADIADYLEFDRPVPFQENAFYYESGLQKDDGSTNKGRFGRPEAQAAHIRPVAASGPDSLRNGVALSSTFHWMFDRGLVSIDDDYSLLLKRDSIPDCVLSLVNADRRLRLPTQAIHHSHPRYLEYHREHVFKG